MLDEFLTFFITLIILSVCIVTFSLSSLVSSSSSNTGSTGISFTGPIGPPSQSGTGSQGVTGQSGISPTGPTGITGPDGIWESPITIPDPFIFDTNLLFINTDSDFPTSILFPSSITSNTTFNYYERIEVVTSFFGAITVDIPTRFVRCGATVHWIIPDVLSDTSVGGTIQVFLPVRFKKSGDNLQIYQGVAIDANVKSRPIVSIVDDVSTRVDFYKNFNYDVFTAGATTTGIYATTFQWYGGSLL